MLIPIDPVLDDMGYDETGRWHKKSYVDFWRWGFSDLRDDGMKNTLADVIAKVMLDLGPHTMSDDELEILRISSLVAANGQPGMEHGRGYDA